METLFMLGKIAVAIGAGGFILAFLLAVCGLFQDNGYMPMSPDEEYEMLTGQYGLTDAEAAEIMRPRPGI